MTTKDAVAEDIRLKTVTIEVNDRKVEMPAGPATGYVRSRRPPSSRASPFS